MEFVLYHQAIPHTVRVRTTTYAFTVVFGVSISRVPEADAALLYRISVDCCNGNRKAYRPASPAQIRLWNGATRPEHFDVEYEKQPTDYVVQDVPEVFAWVWPRVSVIVPVWNKVQTTWSFIQNFVQYGNLANAELIIVDNGSTDQTQRAIQRWFKTYPDKIRQVRHEVNQGVSVGYNAGVEIARAPNLMFFNNDVAVSGDVITPLLQAVQNDPKNIYGAYVIRHNGRWNAFGKKVLPYVEGWCVGCTAEAFEEIGGFDPRYSPCDYEDIDFSYAAEQLGYGLKTIGVPAVHHHMGTSASQLSDRLKITERNRLFFQEKWDL